MEQNGHRTSGMQSTLTDKQTPTPPSISWEDTLIQEKLQAHGIIQGPESLPKGFLYNSAEQREGTRLQAKGFVKL